LLKVRKDKSTLFGPSFSNPGKNLQFLILAGSVLLGCSMCVIFILIGAICHGFFYKKRGSKIDRNGSFSEMNLHCLSYKELQKATDGFKEELGRGAFGIVYKGAIKMGSVSFKDWLMFVSKIERKEPNYYERPNEIHGPSGRDAVKNSNTKTREHRSLTVRSPSERPCYRLDGPLE
jgi:hypothetical protein